jgi:UDP-glucose 4-epimerase
MSKILVSGGTGYIGSHTVVELQNAGFEVAIIDSLANSQIDVIDHIEQITGKRPEFYQFDLKERHDTRAVLKELDNIDAVIHFAAYKSVGESVANPFKYYRNNLQSLMNMIDGMNRNHVRHMVLSSSCTVYGQPDVLPVTEQSPVKPADSPYGSTKQISEQIIQDAIRSGLDMNAIALRYFNPIGAHESAKIGELPVGEPNNLVPYITQSVAGVRGQLKVFGNDYNTPDGTPIRDYIHVVDLAKAHVVAIKRLLEGKNKANYEVFNLGTGTGNSVLEVIKTFESATGQNVNYAVTDRRAGDIEKVWADTTLANTELGWKAEKSLADALRSAWNWEKNYRNI